QSFAFRVVGNENGAVREQFLSVYGKIKDLLAAQQYAEAKDKILAYESAKTVLLTEYSVLKIELFVADLGLGDKAGALRAIRYATKENVSMLDHAQLVDALIKRVLLDGSMVEYQDALDTGARLQGMDALNDGSPAAVVIQKIRARLAD